MENKAYVIDLKFGTWTNQLWFIGENSPAAAEKWEKAQQMLEAIGGGCTSPNEFFNEAAEHFERFGFMRVQK